MHNEQYLVESSCYISLLKNKTLQESYNSIYSTYLKEGINPKLALRLLKEEAKKNPEIIEKLYRKLKWRLQNLKEKNDPTLTKMIKDIVDNSDEKHFKSDLTKLLKYMVSSGSLKESKYDDTFSKALDVYDSCIKKGKEHSEAALRSIISIPFNLKSNPGEFSTKVFKVFSFFIILALIGGLAAGLTLGGYKFIVPFVVAILSLILTGGRYYYIVTFY